MLPTKKSRSKHPLSMVVDRNTEEDELMEDEQPVEEAGTQIPGRLKLPYSQSYDLVTLHRMIHQGTIDPHPPYQRALVWPDAKQVALIDSIFRNYYIPPLLFCVERDPNGGEEIRRVIDGKQRLLTIQKFMDGMIPYTHPTTRKSYYYIINADKPKARKAQLDERLKEEFANHRMVCVEYRNIDAEQERDMFQRVQNGVPLTPAEKLQALASPWVDWIGELQRKYVDEEDSGLNHNIDWTTSRARDFENVAKLVWLLWTSPSAKRTLPTEGAIRKFLREAQPPDKRFKRRVCRVLDAFMVITGTPGLNDVVTKFKRKVAPVEFIYIGVLLDKMLHADDVEKARMAYEMRKLTREKYEGFVRLNKTVTTTLWEFIDSVNVTKTEDDSDPDDGDADYRPE